MVRDGYRIWLRKTQSRPQRERSGSGTKNDSAAREAKALRAGVEERLQFSPHELLHGSVEDWRSGRCAQYCRDRPWGTVHNELLADCAGLSLKLDGSELNSISG